MNTLDEAIRADLHQGEKAYPIYRVGVQWSQSAERSADVVRFPTGSPESERRVTESTGWYTMKQAEVDPASIIHEAKHEWWPKFCRQKRLPEPDDPIVVVKLLWHDVWCPAWFSHWTFDVGMSDEAVLASFERYVRRIEASDLSEEMKGGILMGAEDRKRWHGTLTGDPRGQRTPPPCRCPQCKKLGVVKIAH
jgi:hypothetical protein